MERNVALLPVGTLFNNKRNKTVDDIIEVWGDHECTIQVMDRIKSAKLIEGDFQAAGATTVFVVGSGLGGFSPHLTAKHDQTGAFLGEYKQYGEIQIKDGKVVQKMVVKGRKIPNAAPVQVYK
jgi:hypothetical protein